MIAETTKKIRKTPAQAQALRNYNTALQDEDRYLGSVFVTPIRRAEYEAKTKAAYEACKSLGMTYEHGL